MFERERPIPPELYFSDGEPGDGEFEDVTEDMIISNEPIVRANEKPPELLPEVQSESSKEEIHPFVKEELTVLQRLARWPRSFALIGAFSLISTIAMHASSSSKEEAHLMSRDVIGRMYKAPPRPENPLFHDATVVQEREQENESNDAELLKEETYWIKQAAENPTSTMLSLKEIADKPYVRKVLLALVHEDPLMVMSFWDTLQEDFGAYEQEVFESILRTDPREVLSDT